MANATRTTTWVDNQVLTASALNGEFNNLLNALALDNADIAAGAAIAGSKLANPLTGVTFGNSVQNYVTNDDGSTITFSLANSNLHKVTLGGNRTLAVSGGSTGQIFTLILQQDGTGSRTVTWWSGIKWAGGSAPTLSTAINVYDIFTFIYDGTNYFGSVAGQGYA